MSADLRIAVIADTHDRLVPFVMESIRSADEIWHLGDVCEKATWEAICALGKPTQLVKGNQDSELNWPMSLDLERLRAIYDELFQPVAMDQN